jgi:hypothetical protein
VRQQNSWTEEGTDKYRVLYCRIEVEPSEHNADVVIAPAFAANHSVTMVS